MKVANQIKTGTEIKIGRTIYIHGGLNKRTGQITLINKRTRKARNISQGTMVEVI